MAAPGTPGRPHRHIGPRRTSTSRSASDTSAAPRLAGIKGARIVVAVNSDSRAPIVRRTADYVVVADLYKFIPELLTALGSGS